MTVFRKLLPRVLLYAAVALILLWTLAPFYWMLATSVAGQRDLMSFPPAAIPPTITFERYVQLFGLADPSSIDVDIAVGARLFRRALTNSILVASATTVIGLVVGVIAGYAYARLKFSFSRSLLGITVMVHMLPPIATVIPLYMLLRQIGLLNSLTGLILVYSALAVTYVVWIMNGYFRSVPIELEESARVDGCTRLGALARIVLPVVAPGIVATGLLVFITMWNEFLYALVLINDATSKTVPVMISEFSTQERINYGMIMAGGVIVSLPPVLIAFIFQRRLVGGLTAGAVKG